MRENWKNRLNQFIKWSALDWLPIAFGLRKHEPSNLLTGDDMAAQVAELDEATDEKDLSEVVLLLQRAYEEEEQRNAKIEGKAVTLMGVTGIAFSFVVGFGQFFRGDSSLPLLVLCVLTLLYLAIGISLLVTILIAKGALDVGPYIFKRFGSNAYFELPKLGRGKFYRDYAANILDFIQHNHAVNSNKATRVIAAQNWFRNTIILFLLLLMLLSFSPYLETTSPPQPDVIIVITATPASTPPPTPTPTIPYP